jgi:ankyrin repeat protein
MSIEDSPPSLQRGDTCLHVAAEYNHPRIVPQLVFAGVDINAKNKVLNPFCPSKH